MTSVYHPLLVSLIDLLQQTEEHNRTNLISCSHQLIPLKPVVEVFRYFTELKVLITQAFCFYLNMWCFRVLMPLVALIFMSMLH